MKKAKTIIESEKKFVSETKEKKTIYLDEEVVLDTEKLTMKELAKRLNGIEYSTEISKELQDIARANGLVIIFGASDDLLEMRGLITEEWGAWEGTTVHIDSEGIIEDPLEDDETDQERLKNSEHWIEATWSPEDDDSSWRISTDLPCERFNIMEGDRIYCRGIVISIEDVSP